MPHLTPTEKIEALSDYFGITEDEARAQLVDMGEIDEDEE